jgi:mannose-6-phosphate isomerase-like protein (cupin superfamily)
MLGGMDDKVNLAAALAQFDDAYAPRQIGTYNDNKLLVVKPRGAFVWHKHDHTDDLFLVLSGELRIELRDREPVVLGPGELYVVPRGVEHRPVADEEAHVLLIEPEGTQNTGDAGADSAMYREPEALG